MCRRQTKGFFNGPVEMRGMSVATCGGNLLERQIVLDKEAVSKLHSVCLQKGKNIAAILLPESVSKSRDAHTGFSGHPFSCYFLMEIVFDKHLYFYQDGGIVCML